MNANHALHLDKERHDKQSINKKIEQINELKHLKNPARGSDTVDPIENQQSVILAFFSYAIFRSFFMLFHKILHFRQ